jgi:hypothetical protein
LLAASCFILLDLIQLVIDGRVSGPAGDTHWLVSGERLMCVAVGVLFWAAAAGDTASGCPSCRRHHDDLERTLLHDPPARSAGPVARRIALAGCLSFIPYLSIHGAHAAGWAPQLDALYEDQSIFAGPPLLGWLLFVVCLIGPAVILLQGLVQRWGMVFPRWIPGIGGRKVPRYLPLIPAWLVAPTLLLYGFGSVAYALIIHASLLGLGGAASLAFSSYGTALAVAALSYQQRTKPVCTAAPQPIRLAG